MSWKLLAIRSGLAATTVEGLEKARGAPRSESIVRLAGGLGVEVSELLDGLDWDPVVGSMPGRYVVYPVELPDEEV